MWILFGWFDTKERQGQHQTQMKTINIPANNYMFKVNNRNTRMRFEICSKLTIKTPERRQAKNFSKYLQDLFSRQNVKVWKFSLLLFVFSMRLSVPKKWYNKRKLKNQMVAIKTCLTFLIKYADYLSFPFILLYFLEGTRSIVWR